VGYLTEEEKKELQSQYTTLIKDIKSGEIVEGKIVEVGTKDVMVDIGYKSEGIIPLAEFADPKSLSIGRVIEVIVENVEDDEGRTLVSYNKAQKIKGQ
jgi:small subunit ribosomal protein S1